MKYSNLRFRHLGKPTTVNLSFICMKGICANKVTKILLFQTKLQTWNLIAKQLTNHEVILRSEVFVAAYLYSIPLCVTNVNQVYCICLLLCHCFAFSNTGCYCIVGLHIPQLEERCIFQLVLWWRMVYSCTVNYCSGANNGRSLRLLKDPADVQAGPTSKRLTFPAMLYLCVIIPDFWSQRC